MQNIKKVSLACDHAGYQTKEYLKSYLIELGYKVNDFGCFSEESVDYPDFAHPMANSVQKGESEFGISLCGSGNGINMTVNKYEGIRSALCWNTELAKLAKEHNNANVCALPARFISKEEAKDIINAFINTHFEGGRHLKRIEKIPIKNV
ncbi:MAG: ribose 5-phosphate isomerase B [Bacteroidetes bacterium]|nr:MAG: ribose 5-phosphate isomerase B [Bacteroidota bacterium]RLD84848.1 MAG: ribose 5-phosphate isomerase B [Bacteroidota bacterium]RLD86062.1 MAG: ribose 5-phosphate isomerase B [Bacteroidota bacterium]